MKFIVIFAVVISAAAAGKLSTDYKFEVKHDHFPLKQGSWDESGISGGSAGGFGGAEAGAGAWSSGDYKGDFYAYPKYKFEYGVKDPHTHDHKSQWEARDGDVVKGEYTLDEADGTVRKVSYHADGKTGFHAKVERIGHAAHH